MNTLKGEKINSVFLSLETVFKYCFLILTLMSFNNLVAGSAVIKILTLMVVALGIVVVIYRLLNAKKYIKSYGFVLLILFAVSYFVSSAVNIKYGITENIQAIAWMVFHFGILYATDEKASKEKEKKTYFGLLKLFLCYIALSNIIGIIMLLTNFGRTYADTPNGNLMGYIWGRLWGVYIDPNSGSVFCVAAIIISLYFLLNLKKVWQKILHILNIFISVCYISFSDSRTGLVTLFVSLFIFAYTLIKTIDKIKLKALLKQCLCLICAVVISVTGVVSLKLVKKGYNTLSNFIYSSSYDENTEVDKPDEVGRTGNELEEDISNRRFDLWKSGIEIWKESPVFGVTHRNIVSFAKDKTPYTYMVNNDRNSSFNTTHNSYIDILVSQGIVGTVLFLVFFILVIILVFGKMFFAKTNKNCTYENIMLLSLIATFACSAFFILDIVYINTAGAVIFWMSLGKLVKNLRGTDNDKDQCNNTCL